MAVAFIIVMLVMPLLLLNAGMSPDERRDQAAILENLMLGLGGATELKARVAEFAAERGELPTSWADLRLDDAESAAWRRRLGLALADRGTIVVHVRDADGALAGTVRLEPEPGDTAGRLRWRCASRDFRNIARFVPQCTYRPASGG
jgi:hypothetical protein